MDEKDLIYELCELIRAHTKAMTEGKHSKVSFPFKKILVNYQKYPSGYAEMKIIVKQ